MNHYANSWQPSDVSTSVKGWLQLFMTIKEAPEKITEEILDVFPTSKSHDHQE